jgi:hypothetical protein
MIDTNSSGILAPIRPKTHLKRQTFMPTQRLLGRGRSEGNGQFTITVYPLRLLYLFQRSIICFKKRGGAVAVL